MLRHEETAVLSLDAVPPPQMAVRAASLGAKKANLDWVSTLVLAVLAGAFIAWGGVFFTVVMTGGTATAPFGLMKLVGGLSFSLGLILVVVAGAELFTGNNLIVMAWASGQINSFQLWRNWGIVYLGNLLGAVGIAVLVYFAGVADGAGGAVGDTMVAIGKAKCGLPWAQALAAGIGCNVLVCLAVWLCMSARSVADKVLAIVFPITAFVATGMEHCVANMYFVPAAYLVQLDRGDADRVQWTDFLFQNLLPVTIGNVIGGALLVGLVYWFVYLRKELNETAKPADKA